MILLYNHSSICLYIHIGLTLSLHIYTLVHAHKRVILHRCKTPSSYPSFSHCSYRSQGTPPPLFPMCKALRSPLMVDGACKIYTTNQSIRGVRLYSNALSIQALLPYQSTVFGKYVTSITVKRPVWWT